VSFFEEILTRKAKRVAFFDRKKNGGRTEGAAVLGRASAAGGKSRRSAMDFFRKKP
jgi:hypothetical protein